MGRLRTWFRRLRRRKAPAVCIEEEPPFEEPALVPLGPRPTPGADAIALEQPDEPEDIDARGREAG